MTSSRAELISYQALCTQDMLGSDIPILLAKILKLKFFHILFIIACTDHFLGYTNLRIAQPSQWTVCTQTILCSTNLRTGQPSQRAECTWTILCSTNLRMAQPSQRAEWTNLVFRMNSSRQGSSQQGYTS